MSYHVFHRTWWKENRSGGWPNGLEPCPGEKHTIQDGVETEDEALEICQQWNAENDPGRLSDKAEYERE